MPHIWDSNPISEFCRVGAGVFRKVGSLGEDEEPHWTTFWFFGGRRGEERGCEAGETVCEPWFIGFPFACEEDEPVKLHSKAEDGEVF